MSISVLYVTAPTEAEAAKIASRLVEKRLAACANYWGGVTSVYNWESKLERSQEHYLLVKTTPEKVDDCIEEIKQLHSYKCPCILAQSVTEGSISYFDWVKEQTSS